MKLIHLAVAATSCLILTGCASDAESLQDYLESEWSFDGLYDDITDITVKDGTVTIFGNEKVTETLAQRLCGWASEWVYDQGNGEDGWVIQVIEEEGRVMSQRRHANDGCSFGG